MNKKFKKITGIVTTGALVLSIGTGALVMSNTTASAAEVEEGTQIEEGRFAGRSGQRQRPEGMEAGVRGERPEGMEAGVRGERPEGMEAGEKSGRDKGRQNNLDLEALVEADLLTTDQVADIEILKEEKVADREVEKALIQAMTAEERATYFEAKKAEEKTKFFDVLIEEGILDQVEADTIESYLQEQRSVEKATRITTKLEPLVTDGTLLSSDVDAIIAYLEDLEPREKPVKGEDVIEGEAVVRISPFDEMVSESIISDTQAEAIEALMKPTHKGRR